MTKNTLFTDRRPDVLDIKDLYDPDKPDSGKIIPSLNAIIIDQGVLYYVAYIHPTTHKSTLEPIKIKASSDGEVPTSVIDYGNNRFKLFFDDREEPVKLNIDALLVIFGTANEEYRLKRKDPLTGQEQIISFYYDSDGKFLGDRVPLKKVKDHDHIKYGTNCHTTFKLEEDQLVTMEVFDHAGTMSASITLFTKRAAILNNEESPLIITEFNITSAQEKDDYFYLYEKQSVEALDIAAVVKYNTGHKSIIPIDNKRCFLYGATDFITSFPGLRQPLVCKYFLYPEENGTNVVDEGKGRCVIAVKDVVVVPNEIDTGYKVSVMPYWDTTNTTYKLKYILYSTDRKTCKDITEHVELLSTFNGQDFDNEQHLEISIDMQKLFNLSDESTHLQSIYLSLKLHDNNIERYIIKDTKNNKYAFGVENSTFRRLVLHYDKDKKVYFIPTSSFKNKEAFIEAGYTLANPPYDSANEIAPPVPTHFIIRDLNTTNPIIMTPVKMDEYHQACPIVTTGDPDQYVETTVIVEYLNKVGDDFHILYGVPTDVHISEAGYNE